MTIPYDSLASIAIALLGGGALVKLIELVFNRSKFVVSVNRDEKVSLREDISSLREELQELRQEVETLRIRLNSRTQELSYWTVRFFELKLAVEKIIIYIKSNGEYYKEDERLVSLLGGAETLLQNGEKYKGSERRGKDGEEDREEGDEG